VADVDLSELVQLRHKTIPGLVIEKPRGAVAFFPDYEELDAAGRRKAQQSSTSTTSKES
jgi:hypothetical protein